MIADVVCFKHMFSQGPLRRLATIRPLPLHLPEFVLQGFLCVRGGVEGCVHRCGNELERVQARLYDVKYTTYSDVNHCLPKVPLMLLRGLLRYGIWEVWLERRLHSCSPSCTPTHANAAVHRHPGASAGHQEMKGSFSLEGR